MPAEEIGYKAKLKEKIVELVKAHYAEQVEVLNKIKEMAAIRTRLNEIALFEQMNTTSSDAMSDLMSDESIQNDEASRGELEKLKDIVEKRASDPSYNPVEILLQLLEKENDPKKFMELAVTLFIGNAASKMQ